MSSPSPEAPPKPRKRIFRPLRDRVLVKCDPDFRLTRGGIWIPLSWETKDRDRDGFRQETRRVAISPREYQFGEAITGTVRRVGQGHWTRKGKFIPTRLSPGDRVCFESRRGSVLFIGGEKHILLREYEVDFLIEPENDDMASPALPE